jgi:hypothetical protein
MKALRPQRSAARLSLWLPSSAMIRLVRGSGWRQSAAAAAERGREQRVLSHGMTNTPRTTIGDLEQARDERGVSCAVYVSVKMPPGAAGKLAALHLRRVGAKSPTGCPAWHPARREKLPAGANGRLKTLNDLELAAKTTEAAHATREQSLRVRHGGFGVEPAVPQTTNMRPV